VNGLLTDLRAAVSTIQRHSGYARDLLSGTKARGYGGTNVVNIAEVMSSLLLMRETANEAIATIEAAAREAGAREKAGRGVA